VKFLQTLRDCRGGGVCGGGGVNWWREKGG